MPLHHPEPPNQVTELVSGKLRDVASAAAQPTALGGAAPGDLEPTDPHEVYVLDLADLANADDPLAAARPAGWRFLLSEQGQAVSAAVTTRTPNGEHRFALFNSGPYVGATRSALAEAAELPEVADRDMQVRLLTVPALHLTAVWLHGDSDDVLLPLPPAPAQVTANQPHPANDLLRTLRDPARALANIGPDDQTGS